MRNVFFFFWKARFPKLIAAFFAFRFRGNLLQLLKWPTGAFFPFFKPTSGNAFSVEQILTFRPLFAYTIFLRETFDCAFEFYLFGLLSKSGYPPHRAPPFLKLLFFGSETKSFLPFSLSGFAGFFCYWRIFCFFPCPLDLLYC